MWPLTLPLERQKQKDQDFKANFDNVASLSFLRSQKKLIDEKTLKKIRFFPVYYFKMSAKETHIVI